MYYITGDRHGNLEDLIYFTFEHMTNIDDVMIILGDSGINYYQDERSYMIKNMLLQANITFFCIHGNHEERASNINSYKEKIWKNGIVYYEEDYPNLLFAKDGEIYNFDGKKVIVIGGAYSVDKDYRLKNGLNWFESEQPSERIKEHVENNLNKANWEVDYVLSHTSPLKYEPVEYFLPFINQKSVDKSTEKWLNEIENKLKYKRWYLGHYHCEKIVDKIKIMYKSIDEFK